MARKQKELDITKTGPVGYKTLQAQNNAQFDEVDKFINESQNRILSRASQSNPYRDTQQMVESPLARTDTPWGESIWDNKSANQASFENLGDIRAENQPWYAQIGAGLAKGAILAGTTFLDGTVGLIFGAGTAIGEGRWSGLWDNDFSKAMQSVNEWSEQALPNYYTKEEQEQPWYENIFTANFLGDKFIKNLGFTVGAFYSGGVTAAGLKATKLPQLIGAIAKSSKAPAIVNSAVGATVSAVNEGRIEALNNSKDWFELHKAQLDDTYRDRIQAIQNRYEDTKGTLVRTREGQMVDPAYIEYQNAIKKEQESYNAALGKLSEDRLKMGNADLLMNIPILTASNIIQFGKLYANGFKTARKATNIVGKAGEYTAGTTRLGATAAITKGALSEGTEEISQKAASTIAGKYYETDVNNFYKSKTDPEAAQETLSWTKSFAEGINETVNDGSAWEEFFIGSLTGALGMPRFRGVRSESGSLQSPITIEGGAINEWRDYNEKIARENEIANYMNSRINSPEFKNYYQGLIRHNKYQNDMNRAAEEGDEFNFKNAEHAQLVSDIAMFDNAGKMEDLTTLIDAAFDTSDENLASIVENTTTTLEDGSKVGPFVDKNGNPMYATPEGKQEMIEKLQQNHDEMTNTINNYLKIKDELDIKTGQQLSDDQLEELTWMKSQIGNWAERATAMSGEVKSAIGNVIGNLDSFLKFNQQVRDFEGQSHADLTDRYKQADKNVKTIEGAINTLNMVRGQDDKVLAHTLATSPKFVDGLIKEINEVDETVLSADEKEDITTKLNDIVKLGNASKTYNAKLKEYLENPQKQAEDHARADEQAAQQETKKKSEDLKASLNAAQNLQEFRSTIDAQDDIENRDRVLKELEDEGSTMAKNYRETSQYNNEVRRVLNESDAEPQVKQDAMKLLQDQFNNSENLEQLANPNSIYINNENAFDEDSEDDVELSATRFQEAQYALQSAMSRVNNDNRFKDRFSKEYKKPVEVVRQTTEKDGVKTTKYGKRKGDKIISGTGLSINKDDIPASELESIEDMLSDMGDTAKFELLELREKDGKYAGTVRVNGLINGAPVIDNFEFIFDKNPDKLRGDDRTTTGDSGTSTTPTVTSSEGLPTTELPVGNITAEMVSEENKKANERVETPQRPSRDTSNQFYRPAIPELHIEASKEGDFRPFDIVVGEREKGVDFSGIYGYLRDSGAFRYLNEGNLKAGDELGFMIDPSFNDHTIFIIDKRNGQVVGSLDESDYSVSRYEGLKGLEEKIRREYKSTASPSTREITKNKALSNKSKEEQVAESYKEAKKYLFSLDSDVYDKGVDILSDYIPKSILRSLLVSPSRLRADRWRKGLQDALKDAANRGIKDPTGYSLVIEFLANSKGDETARSYKQFIKDDTTTVQSKSRGKFIASPTTRVSKVMVGRIPYGNTERSLSEIPNVSLTDRKPVFGIIKNGVLTTNSKIDDSLIIKPVDMSQKEGRLYLLIPNGAGKYSPAAVRVKHFNNEEFNLNDSSVSSTPVGEDIKNAITKLSTATSQDDVSAAMQDLAQDLYMQDIMVTWFSNGTGNGVVISKKVRKPDGTYEKVIINGKEQIKEDKYDVYFTDFGKSVVIGGLEFALNEDAAKEANDDKRFQRTVRNPEDIYNEILGHLVKFNLPLQVSARRINEGAYNNRLINSNILTSNITEASVRSTWFTTDYFDNEGNLHQAISPASIAPQPKRKIETPVGGTEGAISGTRIVSVFSNKPYYVDLKTNTIRDDQGKVVTISDYAHRMLLDLAWAQDNFGDSTNSSMMVDNKILTPDGKVLDRSKQVYLSGQDAQDVKDTIAGRKKKREDRVAKSKKVVSEIYENQKRVDKTRTDGEFYYVLEDDGEYHQYSRVHSRLGSNWVESPKQSKALKDIEVQLSRLIMASPKGYNDYLDNLSKKFSIDLSQYHNKLGIKDRQAVLNTIRDKMSGTNSQRALDAGSAVDSIIRQYFTVRDVSKIARPSNMSENAFIDLITTLNRIKSNMEQMGERFLADNIVLFQKYPDGTRVAGEVDILSIDKDGNFRIYDVKTSRYSFYDFTDRYGHKVNYFTTPSATQRMSAKDYYTLQLSAYKNLFESQYGVPVTKLAVMPFVLSYDKEKVSAIQSEKGIFIDYNPSVNVPLVGNVQTQKPVTPTKPVNNYIATKDRLKERKDYKAIDSFRPEGVEGKDFLILPFEYEYKGKKKEGEYRVIKIGDTYYKWDLDTSSDVEDWYYTWRVLPNKYLEKAKELFGESPVNNLSQVLPIFETSLETQNPIEDLTPEHKSTDKDKVGYFELDGKLHKGYITPLTVIDGVEVHVTKVPNITKGWGSQGEAAHVASNNYYAVFPNGKTFLFLKNNPVQGGKTQEEVEKAIKNALEGNKQRVKDLASEKTILFNPDAVPTVSAATITTVETPATINQGNTQTGAAYTAQKEQAINDHDEEFEDELTLRRAKDTTETPVWNQEKELKWLSKVLPQLSEQDRVKVVKGLIKVGKRGTLAWGQFDKGVITLSDIAAEGTAYHEAFHVVFNLLLDNNERQALYDEARKLYGEKDNLSLEEDMAEGFREYVTTRQNAGLLGKIKNFFKDLWIKVTNWNSVRPHLTAYYQMINRGEYSNRELPVETLSQARARQEEYSKEMQGILANAKRDSEGNLLAPNGEKSNLTERQYAQVRTKAFKDWFGEWENPEQIEKTITTGWEVSSANEWLDGSTVIQRGNSYFYVNDDGVNIEITKKDYDDFNNGKHIMLNKKEETIKITDSNYSKVLDENGEPLVMYHRSDDNISIFDINKSRHGGFWFSKDPNYYVNTKAKLKYAIPVFLNIRTPNNISHELFEAAVDGDEFIEGGIKTTQFDGWITKYVNTPEFYGDEYSESIVFAMAIDPNQIKSATDNVGTFSITNDDIRYREVPNSSFESLEKGIQENLLKKGWTAEKFDSISQEERNQAVKCIAF